MDHDLTGTATIDCAHWQAALHGLDGDPAKRLIAATHQGNVCIPPNRHEVRCLRLTGDVVIDSSSLASLITVSVSPRPTRASSTSASRARAWTTALTASSAASIASGASTATFYFRDTTGGSATIAAAAAGKSTATQSITVAATPPTLTASPASGGGGGGRPDLVVQASATPAAPAVGETITYVLSVRNLGGPASRAFVAVHLPSQVAYAGSETDRGSGCTGATTLACDLDFLAGDLVATVRIHAVVRGPGTLTFTATSAAEPADAQPANDNISVVTVIAPAISAGTPVQARPALRSAGAPARVTRLGRAAIVSVGFSVGGSARLQARMTLLRTTRSVPLLAGTSLAGARSIKERRTAAAKVSRGGTYLLRARIDTTRLIPGRTYLVRITAVYPGGQRRALTIRVQA